MAKVDLSAVATTEKLTARQRAEESFTPSDIPSIQRERLRAAWSGFEQARQMADTRKLAQALRDILLLNGLGPKL